ncbi:MAG: gliding motility-associated C-terminal domain-containing protein [Bacteroidales bacterium]|nr:gliding motility-associated C-terminal domain-containing protein [Bacteroidales bacterium]
MKRKLVTILSFFFIVINLHATHNRAGEITYEQISDLTYRFTITTFTYTQSAANRYELLVEWGDNTSSIAPLKSRQELPDFYYHNIYEVEHTFPGPGTFEILVQDPNRNYGVKNIPNSVNTIFSIKTTMIISSWVGFNNTPELLNFPIDKAALGHVFIHNPSAYDPDGDSLSYRITICTGENGIPIEGYTLPEASDSLTINHVTGDLIWNTPVDTGIYNIAIDVEEWRKNIKIGNIVRDMQVGVYYTENNAPVNPPLQSYCVEAGTYIEFEVTSTDADNDPVIHSMTGGPMNFSGDSAIFDTDSMGFGFVTSTFSWQTTCDHVRKQPYQFVLKSEDDNNDIDLVDLSNFSITVLGKAPENLGVIPGSDEIILSWDVSLCAKATGYRIYRKEGSSGFIPDSCENGVPEYTGYKLIDVVSGLNNTEYHDNNKGEGLVQGIEYCYMITAYFADGAESFASKEACTTLIPGTPALLNVSVVEIDDTEGEIFLSWAKPLGVDTLAPIGPYEYQVLRKQNLEDNFEIIASINTPDLNDTIYSDTLLNTIQYPYYYSVILFNNTPGDRFQIGTSEIASSLYLDIGSSDNKLLLNFRKKVPWLNTEYVVYRLNPNTAVFDSIGITSESSYLDENLTNGVLHTYQVKSMGWRPLNEMDYYNENYSHIQSAIPIDTVPPCPPELTVQSFCDSMMNVLTWTNPNNYCTDDVVRYNIYYTPVYPANLILLDSIVSPEAPLDTTYVHYPDETLAACYYVTAVDSFANESAPSILQCVDICVFYELPNVFSPNGDAKNDIYYSKNLNDYVKTVDMKIYNRWGQLVYQTADPDINWNGRQQQNNKLVPSGVYYYICDVYEPRITGLVVRNLVGFIHVYSEEGGAANE